MVFSAVVNRGSLDTTNEVAILHFIRVDAETIRLQVIVFWSNEEEKGTNTHLPGIVCLGAVLEREVL